MKRTKKGYAKKCARGCALPRYQDGGPIKPVLAKKLGSNPTMKEIEESGHNLPTFTVISTQNKPDENITFSGNKPANTDTNMYRTLKALNAMQEKNPKQAIIASWDRSGKPLINEQSPKTIRKNNKVYDDPINSLFGYARSFYNIEDNQINIPTGNVDAYFAELSHAYQKAHIPNALGKGTYGTDYNKPGTTEHNAHSVIEPNLKRNYQTYPGNMPYKYKIDIPTYQEGGPLESQYSQLGGAAGSMIGTALSALGVPGLGGIFGTLGQVVGSKIGAPKDMQNQLNQLTVNKNPYGFALGGALTGRQDAAVYKGRLHNTGGILVNSKGVPSGKPDAEVEGEEVKVTIGGKEYIFSNRLKI